MENELPKKLKVLMHHSCNGGKVLEMVVRCMKSIFERYNEEKEHHQLLTPSSEAKFWRTEAERLRNQLDDLQENYRFMEQLTTEKKREVAVDKRQGRNHAFHYISDKASNN
ncbi:hypothetical protein RND71_015714 [Anisodus tanguticus]|uniref:Uncharacterized protein n=1 Tax=Anisodus tanguticus TaxID=243964 RepID=A0AAE1S8F8_9SOLA|nr:hypothetical protein RND71_015714 [Anisodus tanguticus]